MALSPYCFRAEAGRAVKAEEKVARQAKELARLTREVEQLRADKASLLFDLNKCRAAREQLRQALLEAEGKRNE